MSKFEPAAAAEAAIHPDAAATSNLIPYEAIHAAASQSSFAHGLKITFALGVAITFLSIESSMSLRVIDGSTFALVADDPMITMRVSQNFAAGKGLYFNEGEPVAANTSLFWPIVMAPIFTVASGVRALVALHFISVATFAIMLALLIVASRSLATAILTSLLVICSSWLFYAGSTWEHVPQALFVTSGLLILHFSGEKSWPHVLSRQTALLLLCLGFAMRPDTAIIALAPGMYILYKGVSRSRKDGLLNADMIAVAIAALFPSTYIALHWYFYNDVVPNTFYLKLEGGANNYVNGLRYLAKSAIDGSSAIVVFAFLAIGLASVRRLEIGKRLAVIACLLHVAYVVASGGDVFGGGRFLLPILPFAAFYVSDWLLIGSTEVVPRAHKLFRTAILAACLSSAAASYYLQRLSSELNRQTLIQAQTSGPSYHDPVTQQLALIPLIKAKLLPEDGSIGLFYLGGLAYYLPEYKIVDFLGKADPVIARSAAKWGPVGHNKWDFDHSIHNHNIAVIPFVVPNSDDENRKYLAERPDFAFWYELGLNTTLAQKYTYLSQSDLGLKFGWGMYVRNDLVGRFRK